MLSPSFLLELSPHHTEVPITPFSLTPCQETAMAPLARLRHGPIVAGHLSTLSSWGFPCESKPGVGQPSADSRSCFGSKAQASQVWLDTDVAWHVLE